MLDEHTQFLDDEIVLGRRIVKAVADKTGLDLTYVRWTGKVVHCRNDDWRDIVIVCYHGSTGWIIRSVLKRRGNFQVRWEPNGHAGKGSIELASWEENELIVTDTGLCSRRDV